MAVSVGEAQPFQAPGVTRTKGTASLKEAIPARILTTSVARPLPRVEIAKFPRLRSDPGTPQPAQGA